MSAKQEKKSSEASGRQGISSVYDFLYHDVSRIGSFLAQFVPHGHLKSYVRSMSTAESENSATNYNAKFKVPLMGEAGSSGDIGAGQTSIDGSSMTYDPLWQNSLALLDYLHQQNLINKNILESRISQFVLVSGKLFLFNMELLQRLSKGKMFAQSIRKNHSNKETRTQTDFGLELIDKLPGSIQSIFVGNSFNVWSTLPSGGLSISTDDLILKHGPYISGHWSMLGILDAMPDDSYLSEDFVFPDFYRGLMNFSREIRPHFGRPFSYYGMTPLLIFREVSGG